MSKKIFLIEDNGFMTERLRERLEDRYQCVVSDAYSVASAKDTWDSERGDFDCIILDLHINPVGLKSDESATITPLFGLKTLDYFYQTKNVSKETINEKTILFSKYINEYKSKRLEYGPFAEVIPKDGDSIERVVKAIGKLLNK